MNIVNHSVKDMEIDLNRLREAFISQLNGFYSTKLYNSLFLSEIYTYATTDSLKLAITNLIDSGINELHELRFILCDLDEVPVQSTIWSIEALLLQRYLNLLKSCADRFEGDAGITFNLMINDSMELTFIKLLNTMAKGLGYEYQALIEIKNNKSDSITLFEDIYNKQIGIC